MKQKEIVPVKPTSELFLGTAKAPVKLLLFGDYESAPTGAAHHVIKALLDEYPGQLRYSFRHFPLTRLHQKAHKAAEAAIGAAQEGLFWEMHELLFAARPALGTISLKSYAREAGVKGKHFLDQLLNGDWGWYVQDDLREGIRLGVHTIPALFVNGVLVTGELTTRNVRAAIEEALGAPVAKSTKKRA
ncbi:disulfide bond formation protein DsbA [Flaviaesturariibacter flavus]|uniref:Disulfide bond formation protein DsbA n=1 Tax=Flaviaesturariibacter flavus TaxID=2502780 RepID=A0A4R1B588_9BACT|nr:thioredoxin domain-containing protein [Flaviaesturariibacter flavus]TCJ13294.1 disulfide bond formation protein DsbA [Flaviaesturariibacter flavus]